jgi:hypothetical protein
VEVSVHDNQFTTNSISYQYYELPKYGDLKPTSASGNGGTYVLAPADFNWSNDGYNRPGDLEKVTNVKCRFTDSKGKVERIVGGSMLSYPFHSTDNPNAVACVTPDWPDIGNAEVSFSINGADFSGSFTFKFNEALSESKILPQSGPIGGGTKVKISGQGFDNTENLYVKWGNECHAIEKDSTAQ